MDPPELLACPVQLILRRLDRFGRRGRGYPPASDRLDHGQRLQGMGCVAQGLMGTVQLLSLLSGQLFGLAAYVHLSPLCAVVPGRSHGSPSAIAINPGVTKFDYLDAWCR